MISTGSRDSYQLHSTRPDRRPHAAEVCGDERWRTAMEVPDHEEGNTV
jgi:hypothetical protein